MDASDLSAGHVIAGRYKLRERLGAGGMGEVWVAEHIELNKVVAIKLMLPTMSANDDLRNRFVNEARAAAGIGHPNIVDVIDLGFHNQRAYIAMEKLEGEELDNRISRLGPLPVEDAIRIAIELADAIGAAHEHGIVHRDLKPANVFLTTRGRQRDMVKVLDFGIAKLTQSNSDVHTKTGAVFGSPLYMSPEQLQDSKTVDARADVYAIGGILYAMLTGHPPFNAQTLPQLFYKVVSVPPDSIRAVRPEVPVWLEAVTLAALAKNPEQRPSDARSFARLLEGRGAVAVLAPVAEETAPPVSGQPASTNPNFTGSASALTPMYSTAPPSLPIRRHGLVKVVGLVVLALGVVGAAFLLLRPRTPRTEAVAASTESASSQATPEAQPVPSVQPLGPPDAAPAAPAPSASGVPSAPLLAPVPKRATPKGTPKSPTESTSKPAPPPLVPR